MKYPSIEALLELRIHERFPTVAGPAALRERAQELLREAMELRLLADLDDDTPEAQAQRSGADYIEEYAAGLLQKARSLEGELPAEQREHRCVQVRKFLATVLAHGLVSTKRQEAGESHDNEYALLHAAIEELSQPADRRAYRAFVQETARDFDLPLEGREARRVTVVARRQLERLLTLLGDDEEPDTPLTVDA